MTFTSEVVRICYHQLPTEYQSDLAQFEDHLAQHRQHLHVDAVMRHENQLELVFRVRIDCNRDTDTGDGIAKP